MVMDSPITPIEPIAPAVRPAAREPARRCAYCGAPLHPNFYFCLACATPYQGVEAVLPVPVPPYLSDGQLIARKAPGVWPLFWTYCGVILGSWILALAFRRDQQAIALVISSLAMLVATLVFGALHWPSLAVQLKRFGFFRWEAYAGLAALAPLLAVNYFYHGWLRSLVGERGESGLQSLGLSWSAMVVLICVFPAVLEETAFRGLIQHWLQTAITPLKALVLASALFTALHCSLVSAPYLFAVGMLLGWVKQKTGSLYPSMLIHFLHNFVVLAFFGL
jgi:membrane protease YdiL (CAAX protease family)